VHNNIKRRIDERIERLIVIKIKGKEKKMGIKNIKQPSLLGILALSILLLTIVFAPIVQAQSPEDSAVNDAYDFPVKPGTEEWKTFQTHGEMLEACQIPEDILKNISTSGLVETVLNYPLLGDYRCYNDFQYGFNQVVSRSNGIQELFARKDAGIELLAKYCTLDPVAIQDDWTDAQKGFYAWSIQDVEMMLVQEQILGTLTYEQCQDLVKEARIINIFKQQHPEVFSSYGLASTTLVIERASQRQYSSRWYYGTVYTPNGSSVEVKVDLAELSQAEINAWSAWVATNYPLATKLYNATQKYNCHSYAWYSQSSSNIRWMNYYNQYGGSNVSEYWTDGSYSQISGGSAYPGVKLFYGGQDHSAIFYGYSLYGVYTSISKWGPGPRMQHDLWYCPYYPNSTVYYYE